MKKTFFVLMVAFVVVGMASAQGYGYGATPSQSVSISGVLGLQNGSVSVTDGKTVYLVPALNRYIGFIDGFKEGAQVSVSGYAYGNQINPVTVTIAGKSYDFSANGVPGNGYSGAPSTWHHGGGHHGGGSWGHW
jgi:hypothetical protein